MDDQTLTQKIIGCAMAVHRELGPGFLESVYQKALAHELGKAGLKVLCEYPIRVAYDGVAVGEFSADMWARLLPRATAPILLNPVNPVRESASQANTKAQSKTNGTAFAPRVSSSRTSALVLQIPV